MQRLRCGTRELDLARPCVMGILNATPDSFSDGGRFLDRSAANRRIDEIIAEGADIIDIGGESTRPGATAVGTNEEMDRVLPLVEQARGAGDILISVDTMKPEVMSAALAAGADMINDVNALRAPGALEVIAASNAGVCLMHMQGTPRAMQDDPRYGDVLAEVTEFLTERVRACTSSGIAQERLLVDPGLGFGKDLSHNLQLMAGLPRIQEIGPPVLVGLSRKTMIGKLLNREPHERLFGSLGGALAAVCAGAAVLRVHDVAATVEALTVFQACRIGTAP